MPDITVIGSGVIGLSAALRLQTSRLHGPHSHA